MTLTQQFRRSLVCLAAGTLVAGAAQAGAVITYGNTSLGVNDTGELNFAGNGPGGDLLYGVYRAGVGDGISPGCPCEGWGVSLTNAGASVATFANQSTGSGGFSTETGANFFGSTVATATSLVTMADAPVTIRHAYGPSLVADVFQVQVTITNTSGSALSDLVYRRAMDWDIPPTTFNEFVTHSGVAANLVANGGNVAYAGNNGFANSDPRTSPTWDSSIRSTYASSNLIDTTNTDFDKAGPYDHGSVFDFSFGALAAGQSRIFNIYYGTADNEASARSKASALGANLFSLGQSSDVGGGEGGGGGEFPTDGLVPTATMLSPTDLSGATPGDRPTFLFAFGGVGGTEIGTSETVPILPFVPAPGEFFFDAPVSGRWYDPPFATGFTITVVGGDMLSITAPTGFTDLSVVINGTVVDSDFDAGDTYTFAAGVRTFDVTGMNVDTAGSAPFPLFMAFQPSVTSMTWTAQLAPVPEAGTSAMLAAGLAALGLLARRRKVV